MDGSNAYPSSHPNDIPGIYQNKDALNYSVVLPANEQGDKQYALVWYFPKAGSAIEKHKHTFKHYSILVRGSVIVTGEAERPDGTVYVAHDTLRFEAGVEHSIKALVDDTHMVHLYPLNVLDATEG